MRQQILKPVQNRILAPRHEIEHCNSPVRPSLGQRFDRRRKPGQPWLHLGQKPPHPLCQIQIRRDHIQRMAQHANELAMPGQQFGQRLQVKDIKARLLDPDRLAVRHLPMKAEQHLAQRSGDLGLGDARKAQTSAHPDRNGVGRHIL